MFGTTAARPPSHRAWVGLCAVALLVSACNPAPRQGGQIASSPRAVASGAPSDVQTGGTLETTYFDELYAGRSTFYGRVTFQQDSRVRVDEVYAEIVPLGPITGRTFHADFKAALRNRVAAGEQATVIATAGLAADGFAQDQVRVDYLVDEHGMPEPLDDAHSFELITGGIPGDGHAVMIELFRRIAREDFYTQRAADPAAAWLATDPDQRTLDTDTPQQVLDEFATLITIAVDLPDHLQVVPPTTIEEADLTLVEIYDPAVASVLTVTTSAGDYLGPAYVPIDGHLWARITSNRSGQVSTPVSVDGLLDTADDRDAPTIVVTDHGYDPARGNVEALTISTRTAPPG